MQNSTLITRHVCTRPWGRNRSSSLHTSMLIVATLLASMFNVGCGTSRTGGVASNDPFLTPEQQAASAANKADQPGSTEPATPQPQRQLLTGWLLNRSSRSTSKTTELNSNTTAPEVTAQPTAPEIADAAGTAPKPAQAERTGLFGLFRRSPKSKPAPQPESARGFASIKGRQPLPTASAGAATIGSAAARNAVATRSAAGRSSLVTVSGNRAAAQAILEKTAESADEPVVHAVHWPQSDPFLSAAEANSSGSNPIAAQEALRKQQAAARAIELIKHDAAARQPQAAEITTKPASGSKQPAAASQRTASEHVQARRTAAKSAAQKQPIAQTSPAPRRRHQLTMLDPRLSTRETPKVPARAARIRARIDQQEDSSEQPERPATSASSSPVLDPALRFRDEFSWKSLSNPKN